MIRRLSRVLFFVVVASTCSGIELELRGKAENLYWSPTALDTVAGRTFRGSDLYWGLQGSVTQEVGDGIVFRGGVENDPILRTRAYSQLGFSMDNLSLNFAPFLGTFNSTGKWFNPGLEALLEYNWPGAVFLRGGFLTTFAPVAKSGDYYLSSLTAAVGTMMENGILSLNVVDKAATFRGSGLKTTVDASTKYWLDLEMFQKNFPLRWAFLTGYQLTSRSYLTDTESKASLHSVLMGTRLSWDIGRRATLYCEANSVLFQTSWDDAVLRVPSDTGVFQAVTGVRYRW